MKKLLLPFLLISVLFFSCQSDDENDTPQTNNTATNTTGCLISNIDYEQTGNYFEFGKTGQSEAIVYNNAFKVISITNNDGTIEFLYEDNKLKQSEILMLSLPHDYFYYNYVGDLLDVVYRVRDNDTISSYNFVFDGAKMMEKSEYNFEQGDLNRKLVYTWTGTNISKIEIYYDETNLAVTYEYEYDNKFNYTYNIGFDNLELALIYPAYKCPNNIIRETRINADGTIDNLHSKNISYIYDSENKVTDSYDIIFNNDTSGHQIFSYQCNLD